MMGTKWEKGSLVGRGEGGMPSAEAMQAGLQGSQKICLANCRYFEERQAEIGWTPVPAGYVDVGKVLIFPGLSFLFC